MHVLTSICCSVALVCLSTTVQAIPYSEYILAPSSRTLYPASVHRVNGTVSNASSLTGSASGSAIFNGTSAVTYDYGKNIAGLVSITVGASSSLDAYIGLGYSESSLWINSQASDATADAGLDELLWFNVGKGPGTYTVAREYERGGFRYLSLYSNSSATVEVTGVSTYFTAAPDFEDLQAYTGYFHSDDELINRIWYAGRHPLFVHPSMSPDSASVTLTVHHVQSLHGHERYRCESCDPADINHQAHTQTNYAR